MIRINISRTGVGPEKTGFAGALAGGRDPGADERVEIEIDAVTTDALAAAAGAAAAAFATSFAQMATLEAASDESEDDIEEPHVCDESCIPGATIINIPFLDLFRNPEGGKE